MQIVFFENSNTEALAPVTLTRPAFDIRCAGTTLYELSQTVLRPTGTHSVVRPMLRLSTSEKFPAPKAMEPDIMFLDACIVPDVRVLIKLREAVTAGQAFKIVDGQDIVVLYLPGDKHGLTLEEIDSMTPSLLIQRLQALDASAKSLSARRFQALPDLITRNIEILPHNIETLATGMKKVQPEVFVGPNVVISSGVVFDTTKGGIVIGENTKIGPNAVLYGPIVIGKNCQVNPLAFLVGPSSIGDVCKIGGEVGESVIQGYTNKQHYGCLGHSYVGAWVNLGGGTSNSDLKNTYGEIKMLGQATGCQFLGNVIGDYSKTSIGTMLYTGKVIGVGSMLFGAVTADVPSFTNAGSLLKKSVELPIEIAIRVQTAVMARRNLSLSPADQQLLKDIFTATGQQRRAEKVKKGKLQLH